MRMMHTASVRLIGLSLFLLTACAKDPVEETPGTNGGTISGTNNGSSAGTEHGTWNGEDPGLGDITRCDDASLNWRSGYKTWYESYPEPGSEEWIDFNGGEYVGLFEACWRSGRKSEAWVAGHNIVAAFPDFQGLREHDLCVRKDGRKIVVTVLDTCADSDCDGCCSDRRGDTDELIDFEWYTNERFAADDGWLEWADLGPTQSGGCDD